jgi:uncharacterized protein YbcI
VSTDRTSSFADPLSGGQLSAAISNALVRVHREYLGRGPTRVRTSVRDNLVIVLLEDVLTRAEQSLVAHGKTAEVLAMRASFQHTMKEDIITAVQELTGRRVLAFMSSNHVDPDLACEVLVLEPERNDGFRDAAGLPDD